MDFLFIRLIFSFLKVRANTTIKLRASASHEPLAPVSKIKIKLTIMLKTMIKNL